MTPATPTEHRSTRDRLAEAQLLEILASIAVYLASGAMAAVTTDDPVSRYGASPDVTHWRHEAARHRAQREEIENEIENSAQEAEEE
jgi:hypothetical protein